MELANAWRSKSFAVVHNRYVLWFLLSVCFFLMNIAYQKGVPKTPLSWMIVSLVLEILCVFSFTVYFLFRGIFVLSQISGEGEQHPAYLAMRKLTQRRFLAYSLACGTTLLLHAGRILATFWWCMSR